MKDSVWKCGVQLWYKGPYRREAGQENFCSLWPLVSAEDTFLEDKTVFRVVPSTIANDISYLYSSMTFPTSMATL